MSVDYFDLWHISKHDLNKIIDLNPSIRGMVFGYVAEYKLREIWFPTSNKLNDHDISSKGDLLISYRGRDFSIEAKSLQTHTIAKQEDCFVGGDFFVGKVQCDASDCRKICLANGDEIKTTCLSYGEFDILAVNLFAFFDRWVFCFIQNKDIPHTTSKKYTKEQQKYLLSTILNVTWPMEKPFYLDPFKLIDDVLNKE